MIPARRRFDAMNSRIAGPIAGLFMLAAWAVPGWALDIDVADFKLANGMEVVVIPDHRAPVVTHMVWYKVGSADEPQGKSGIAHFLEHLLFKGTAKYPAGEFSRLIRLNGGEENAFTTRDYTGYFQRIARDRLELVMELEADRMQNLVLTDENVLPELQVVQEERASALITTSSLLGEQLEAAMATVTLWQAGDRLDVRGDATHPSGRRRLQGPSHPPMPSSLWRAMLLPKRKYWPRNTMAGSRTVRAHHPQAHSRTGAHCRPPRHHEGCARRLPMVQRSYLAPSYSTATGNEATALTCWPRYWAAAPRAAYRKLVIERKLAAYTGAWYSGDASTMAASASMARPTRHRSRQGRTGDRRGDCRCGEERRHREELDRTRAKLADTVYTLDSQATLARMFGTALTTGSTAADVLGWESKIEKLTAADIQKAAAGVLRIEASVTGQLIPEPSSSQN
jgi:zinc protease